jgi:hypothetical protein
MNDFWSACLSRFERELPAQQFNTWIKGLQLGGRQIHRRSVPFGGSKPVRHAVGA